MPHTKPSLESTLTRAWLHRGPLACALLPLSLLFRALAGLRVRLFRSGMLASTKLPVPVVVVGNIFIGGTGKTPLTIWLAEALRDAGFTPGIISRGHGGEGGAPRAVTNGSNAQEVGDEPLLMARRTGCPVVVGRKRAEAGLALLAFLLLVDWFSGVSGWDSLGWFALSVCLLSVVSFLACAGSLMLASLCSEVTPEL